MTRKFSILLALILGVYMTGLAQESATSSSLAIKSKPKNMWEVGLHVGHNIVTGDVDWDSGFGVGLHARKSLDYVFSLRFDASYESLSGEEEDDLRPEDGTRWRNVNGGNGFGENWQPEYETRVISGDATLVASLNQFKVFKKNKINPYLFAGAGIGSFDVMAVDGNIELEIDDLDQFDDDWSISTYLTGGFGIAFKLGKKVSIGLEHKIKSVLGRGDDLLDAAELLGSSETSSRDLINYTNIRLAIPIGKGDDTSQPLYWASPLDLIADDLAEVKARPIFDNNDTDGDGVVDAFDQENNTAAGCPVDTRGVTLDSDGDGIADCKDKEPYSPPGYKVDNQGVADVPAPDYINENDVNRIVDAKLKDFRVPTPAIPPMDWFLPMVNFDNNKYAIKNSEYAKLRQIAQVMKQHPGLRVVATGFTDATASNCYNDVLSYNRSQAAIDYMVSKYGIGRDRFVLNYSGENDLLVPTNSKSLVNRRVEFKVATIESNVGKPDCGVNNAGTGGSGYSGNKESGY